ncbi:putative peptide maturation dehydrogenase [Duganella sp. FT50W]|uniref:Peptide maturation dehydrogenase n=1 Tax=Duganella lactea TaxID=2692173 RepID=A0A6L8MPY4_9BURK|nr:putative peptide maturation dehydrogenase [Duganella lactea]MYM34562.1 putative peptide maturation dehydrogenase [Duganella lactea]MYM84512.1 putative peptide maturation dehydrogenase [Duganella lactea]
MKLRRCAVLYVESREELAIDWKVVLSGGSALAAKTQWMALAPHLDLELAIDARQLAALGGLSHTVWTERAAAEQQFGEVCVASLLELGLLIGDTPQYAAQRERDETLRAAHWRPLSALAHTFGRWRGVTEETGMEAPTFQALLERYGEPPPPTFDLGEGEAVKLPGATGGPMDAQLLRRYTGRNYDPQGSVSLDVAARLLQRTFGAQEVRQVGPHASVLKKTSPSGGGLHPIEAFVLAQRVDGVAPGLYHYHPLEHALRPLRKLDSEAAAQLARYMLADQHWLSGAPLQVVLVARMERSFWKYRNHQKAYRALALDAGHLSQTFYLLATEAGYPAFITAAINDADIEKTLGLDHLRHAVVAMCGCGPASDGERAMVELRYGETDVI